MLDAPLAAFELVDLPVGLPAKDFKMFINKIYQLGASDIKFQSNDFVWADINRRWTRVSKRRLEPQEIDTAVALLNDVSALGILSSGRPIDDRVDLAINAEDINEFRLNATACTVGGVRDGASITLRAIPKAIPTVVQLKIEAEILENAFPRYGLILIVGTTGSGKSTTQASLNQHRLVERRHDPVAILTFEDPVEYLLSGLAQGYMPEPCQSAIGPGHHLREFAMAGPNAMRRRADVIVLGEIRDMDSARTAGEMTRTGHAVQATMHVDTPGDCFDRLIKFFPPEQQVSEAFALLSQLRLVIAQKLARTVQGGKIAFRSWIVVDKSVKDALSNLPIDQWSRFVAQRVAANGNDFEAAAFRAFEAGLIAGEVFCEVSGLTKKEAHAFITERGGDVSRLG